jgi:hypothetical protein
MVQVYVFPKWFRPRGSRYLVSFHLSGREIRLIITATIVAMIASVLWRGWGAIYVGFAISVLYTLALQLYYMHTVHVPSDVAKSIDEELDKGAAMVVHTTFATIGMVSESEEPDSAKADD